MGIKNATFRKVESYLQEDIFYIPEYQRGYSWEESQLDDFWEDLTQMHNDHELDSHFLGQIVIHSNREDKRKYIIDGQQRTSTVIILLDAFRTTFKSFNNQDAQYAVEDITSKYIGRYSNNTNELRLHLGKNDFEVFRNYIQSSEKKILNQKHLSKSEQRIIFASDYFKRKIFEYIDGISDVNTKFISLKRLYESLIRKMLVMYVETDDINEAFIIFETLNARGKDLETSDLLKNHVFRIAGNKIDEIQSEWNNMIETIGKIEPTKFIRHYWNSQNKFIREKDLYKSLRKKVTSPEIANALVKELSILSEVYVALNNPKENIYFTNNQLNEKIQEMNVLNAKSYFPIILSLVASDYDEEDILKVLKAIECLVVRNFVVAGKVANKYEKSFSKIAYEINDDEHKERLKSVDEIILEIKKETISDEEFQYSFSQFSVKKTAVIRYILRAVNNYYNSETRIINDNSKVHIEHIMPKSLSKGWEISTDEHEEYLQKLGNLTLLGDEYNRNATNKTFEFKKEIYANSQIKITNDLINHQTWSINDIKKRQENLAKIALEIWNK
ncbi:DUF262 domain-containing protein [Macrococcus capreoli]|uniref:DUF262 domain-containing protein n=1 Tax=Macrococcus capreoli TaxID=2982690 RepID=UPI0021D60383|nr:DUF262 domain-containing HNH endonuclease family protein [Macrococcus sp. TMW 2.2395]MCU7558428.1 DUF262 domain-containing HNH endonuclease family protein [Macrococcus sp. TMW 2.2395]